MMLHFQGFTDACTDEKMSQIQCNYHKTGFEETITAKMEFIYVFSPKRNKHFPAIKRTTPEQSLFRIVAISFILLNM